MQLVGEARIGRMKSAKFESYHLRKQQRVIVQLTRESAVADDVRRSLGQLGQDIALLSHRLNSISFRFRVSFTAVNAIDDGGSAQSETSESQELQSARIRGISEG